jgi:RNA polymerase sigma-70 factor (ECF subfamily)
MLAKLHQPITFSLPVDLPGLGPQPPTRPHVDALSAWSEEAVRLAYHLTHDREAALDLSQEAFVKAVEALPSLQDSACGRVWFMRIVVNLCRDWHRRRAAERKALGELVNGSGAQSDPAFSLQHKEALERVRAALMSLPLDYREALALVVVEAYSPKEAAAVLGIADGTLRWRLFEARRLLKEELECEKG